MTPGPPFSLQGLTFSVLGSTGTHLWDHPGAPERPFETTLAHLRNQTRKKRRIFTALGLTFDVLGDPGGHFWATLATSGPVSEQFWVHVVGAFFRVAFWYPS